MTSSKNRTATWIADLSSVQSNSPLVRGPFTKADKLIEPRLHGSFGRSGCSPHGFVASMDPSCGVGFEPEELILSMKIIPGSPELQALLIMESNTSRAFAFPAIML